MAVLEQEREKKEEMTLKSLTPAQLRATMTLREMLEIGTLMKYNDHVCMLYYHYQDLS